MPLTTFRPKILAGQSLSAAFDCTTGTLLAIAIPANWTPANISFQVSADGVDYHDVVNARGKARLFTAIAGTAVTLGQEVSWKGMHLKIRSGSIDAPVIQIQDVEFTIALQT